MKLEAECSSETLLSIHKIAISQNPGNINLDKQTLFIRNQNMD
jgi:hypothetical protein